MRKVAIYSRVSRPDQEPQVQADALLAYAEARGLEVVAFEDHGVSGARTSRPGFDAMMRAVRRREVDGVVVVKLDRLGRNLHHLLSILGELDALGVQLVAIDDGLDTSTPVGRLFFQIRGAFAEYERALIRERTIAGLERAKRQPAAGKKRPGRPRNLEAARVAESARRLLAHGVGLATAARQLGVPRNTLRRALTAA